MGFDGVDEFRGVVLLTEEAQRGAGMAVLLVIHVGKAVVVQIVEQTGQSPEIFILAIVTGIEAHGRLHRQHVATQTLCFDPFI